MLEIRKLTPDHPDITRARTLYETAFPEEERRPWDGMLHDPAGDIGIYGLYLEKAWRGSVIHMTQGDICHLMYFAVEQPYRDQGLGGRTLETLRSRLPGLRIIVDIEREDPAAPDAELRHRRKGFYLRHGYRETGVFYTWQSVDYEILCDGGTVTEEEFWGFWKQARARKEAALAKRK